MHNNRTEESQNLFGELGIEEQRRVRPLEGVGPPSPTVSEELEDFLGIAEDIVHRHPCD